MRRQPYRQLLLSALFLIPLFLSASAAVDVIIPKPQKTIAQKGHFVLNDHTRFNTDTALSRKAEAYLQAHLRSRAGYMLKKNSHTGENTLQFRYAPKQVKHAEAYRLAITPGKILIEARDEAGFFYAVISMMQLMDPAIWRTSGRKITQWKLPACSIEDHPHYAWRGMMLDCSRTFFSKAYVKKFIDRMAQQKLNRFHWHLTDDEGWRIEIKKYPLLTQIGARRGPGTRLPFSTFPAMRGPKNRVESGYYSQRDIREVVAYAKARCIEILPEIDMPGHAKAAVTAYPKLLQDPRDTSRYRSVQKVANNTMDPGLESTYTFLDNVISEVSTLFPFGYIHLGGDEVPKGAWKSSPAVKRLMRSKKLKSKRAVQNYFFARMDRILARHHRKLIAWQEVAKGSANVRTGSRFMAWKSAGDGIGLARAHRQVIMAPVQYFYFDQQYVRSKKEPGHTWSTPVSTQKTYGFKAPASAYIKGVHGCLWSERAPSEKTADYLTWPRMLALSEVAWSDPKKRNWRAFQKRAERYALPRLKAQHIHYRPVLPIR